MTYKEKLIELLKTDEEVKGQMENLEFGCEIKNGCEEGIIFKKNKSKYDNSYEYVTTYGDICEIYFDGVNDDYEGRKIIGLPLQERFIRMYSENKKEIISMYKNELQFHRNFKSITLDNNLDFDQQDDSVYQKIYEALTTLE